MDRKKRANNKDRGDKGVAIAQELLKDLLDIDSQVGVGNYGKADLYGIYNGTPMFIEVKLLKLWYSTIDGKGIRRPHLSSVKVTKTQLEALRKAEANGYYAFFLIILATRQRKIPLVFLPDTLNKTGAYPSYSVSDILRVAFPLQYLPLFLKQKTIIQTVVV